MGKAMLDLQKQMAAVSGYPVLYIIHLKEQRRPQGGGGDGVWPPLTDQHIVQGFHCPPGQGQLYTW
jgi:hypothetical protein